MQYEQLLTDLGLSAKAARVYLKLLERGSSSIRQIAEATNINRQTTHELLRELVDVGLVSYYGERSRQAFVAEDPSVLSRLAAERSADMQQQRQDLERALPELRQLYGRVSGLATVRYYSNLKGVRTVLEDVLETVERLPTKLYRVYSSAELAPIFHQAYPRFTDDRIAKHIKVRVFGLGGRGAIRGLDERKQLTQGQTSPCYILIYGQKVAMVSLDERQRPRGILIEDEAIAETLQLIFDTEWTSRST